ncbi:MAG TPA: aconitate hydratase, partial [Candidatus Tripitaka californicus]|uniref:aconitate hydratase n=2 Tax=Candidatus Tripitaka californicus TaxID=3367616 RepID=UPI004024A9C2
MGKNLVQKILQAHLVSGELKTGSEIGISIDQTLTQDATGTMVYLQFESIGIPRVKTKLSVSYVDHNTLQTSLENSDDHLYLQTVAARYGIYYSRPGNGICHQVHLERFAIPGQTLLGSDSHTPTCGGLGMIAIGAGGLDVAVAMSGSPFFIATPKIVLVKLLGHLRPWVSAKDVILHLLQRLTVKGGVGKIFEYGGPGIRCLSIPERSTITNMGAELGATTSLFPSDEISRQFLKTQHREKDWIEQAPDKDAQYEEELEVNLNSLEPLIALPHSPDNVRTVKEVAGTRLSQICIGSCTNSSYNDLMVVAKILKGKTIPPEVSVTISPGSRQVLENIAREGALEDLIGAGARVLEPACGPCIGMGQAPPSGGVSLRTFNRNFRGRSGTPDAQVYLASAETAAASALTGVITDPRELGKPIKVKPLHRAIIDDKLIVPPAVDPSKVEIIRGPNIKEIPKRGPIEDTLEGEVLIKLKDNVSTDDVLPAGTKVLAFRSNIPAISRFTFEYVDPDFVNRARKKKGGFILAGSNYGQGSSREHAALAPMHLGVKAVLAKSFARIHRVNLINAGLLPLVLEEEVSYDQIDQGDRLRLKGLREAIKAGKGLTVTNVTKQKEILVNPQLTPREAEIILAGGLLNHQVET